MYHKTQLGEYGQGMPSDLNGYVPETGDSPDSFEWSLTTEKWDADSWAEFVAEAVAATKDAEAKIAYQNSPTDRNWVRTLDFVGWRRVGTVDPESSDVLGYNADDYFDANGAFLGPNSEGIYPAWLWNDETETDEALALMAEYATEAQ